MPPERRIIAVVDDDESIRNGLCRQLRAAGYRCELFESAERFLPVAAISRAACVLSDIHLGGMTGLELALHPVLAELNLPVLLMSGTSDPMIEIPAREIAAGFLRKPILTENLVAAIVEAIGPPIVDDN
jgi:FixJ family two-component response regulator